MKAIQIRDARPEEYDDLLALVMAAYGEFEGLVSADYNFRDDVVRLMNDEHTEVIVAEVGGSPAGTITFFPEGGYYDEKVPSDWACLRTLAVLPTARGQGVGRALMEECLSRARSLGRTRMLLHTLPFMSAAIALHESLGFSRAPELDIRYLPDLSFLAYLLDL